ncbi:sulfite exporter TauE/SafE family protein [Polynucleobacter antarcticus]|uniref:Probable membrane transporter protein n=1 Tax=Polynucleobacter antarcticus TaxID=1743162 RepID=A0A6M9PL87_9BURK|nr:sulfite exporter TauE/SafE family protein [Polynucleobacter antarcticus]QKM62984.1 hypothetical protein DCO16_07900 [Polynucleobacter antarcticus]
MASLAIFIAYFIFGISGFGASLVAVPILAQFYPLQSIVPVMVLIDIVASLYLGRRLSGEADKAELIWILPFTLLGMLIGITLLLSAPSEPLLAILGCFATLNGVRVLMIRKSDVHKKINQWWALPFGIAGGIFTALFATGGAIYASYLQMRIANPHVVRATMAFAILMLTFLRLIFMIVTGLLLSSNIFGLAIALVFPMGLGMWLGTRMHSKMSMAGVQRIYGLILLFSGLLLVLRQF